MKPFALLLTLIAFAPSAFAGKSLNLTCAMNSADGTIVPNLVLKSGFLEPIQCPGFICDDGKFVVEMNYNGSSSPETLSIKVDDKSADHISESRLSNFSVGSSLEAKTVNSKTGRYLKVDCEITGIH